MIKDIALLARFEQALLKRESFTYKESLRIMESLWQEGCALGVLPPADPLAGIETDIKIARILNRCSSSL